MPVPVNQPVVVRVVERICNRELRGLFFIFAKGLGTKDEGFGEIMVATGISHLDGFEFLLNPLAKSKMDLCPHPSGCVHKSMDSPTGAALSNPSSANKKRHPFG